MRVNRICCNRCSWQRKEGGVKMCTYYYEPIAALFAFTDETDCSAYEPRIKRRL